MWRDLWSYRRRAVVIAASVVAALLAVAVVLAATFGAEGRRRTATPSAPTRSSNIVGTPAPSAPGYDHAPWNAVPLVPARTSSAFPPIPAAARIQPDLFVTAFGRELLTRDYRHSTRGQLLAWAQSESAALSIRQVPLNRADRAKALLVSISNPAWDDTSTAIVPTQARWRSLAAQRAYTTVSDVKVETVPGFPPANTTFADPLSMDRLFTATVTLHAILGQTPTRSATSVAFEVVLGTSQRHGRVFGAAETQHYVVKEYTL